MTSYKALKETEARPGDFVTIIGAAGGLGHLAIQYGKAMGLRVIAMDVGDDKLKYCEGLGAEFVVDASSPDAADTVRQGSQLLCYLAQLLLRDADCNYIELCNLKNSSHFCLTNTILFVDSTSMITSCPAV